MLVSAVHTANVLIPLPVYSSIFKGDTSLDLSCIFFLYETTKLPFVTLIFPPLRDSVPKVHCRERVVFRSAFFFGWYMCARLCQKKKAKARVGLVSKETVFPCLHVAGMFSLGLSVIMSCLVLHLIQKRRVPSAIVMSLRVFFLYSKTANTGEVKTKMYFGISKLSGGVFTLMFVVLL